MDTEALIHFVGGAVGGTIGTALTCPLEVIKTRLQSSDYSHISSGPCTSAIIRSKDSTSNSCNQTKRNLYGRSRPAFQSAVRFNYFKSCSVKPAYYSLYSPQSRTCRVNAFTFLNKIIASEGIGALYKGLLPNLIGVAPSKAVYFYAYSSSKRFLNDTDLFVPNSAVIHMLSAGVAGFLSATAVNPIWLVKTRLQLNKSTMSVGECFKRVLRKEGIRGFYKGVTASYAGVSETVIQFVIYEELRNYLMQLELNFGEETVKEQRVDFINFMIAGGFAKFVACIVAYPHEVARTRLREENSKNKGFFATLSNVYRLEGFRALYRGLPVQLMRTVPNTAVTMGAYELVVIILQQLLLPS